MIQIVPSTIRHVTELSETMNDLDKKEIVSLGMTPRKALFYSYKFSLMRRTGLVDGGVVAMWGVFGVPMGITGQPYLLTSPLVKDIPVREFVSVYKNEVRQMKKLFPVLENYVDASYEGAVRMLRITGFSLEPVTLNDKSFYKFRIVS